MLGVQVWGGYAQYVCLPAGNTHLIPEGLDVAAATIVARHAPLAFNLLTTKANLVKGEWVLVMGAAGGLGSAGLQVARHLGAKVIAAAGADDRVDAAMKLGADFGINYRSSDLAAEVRRITEARRECSVEMSAIRTSSRRRSHASPATGVLSRQERMPVASCRSISIISI
jgi:NADPH:quinone reductase